MYQKIRFSYFFSFCLFNNYYLNSVSRRVFIDIMNKAWSLKSVRPFGYQLKRSYEEKYFQYLKRRYGEKRAHSFINQSS